MTNSGTGKLSVSIERLIREAPERLADQPKRASIFVNCLANTWNTTFVITRDIPTMWLRDSAAQIRPFLLLASEARKSLTTSKA